jgi:hypothetical protein
VNTDKRGRCTSASFQREVLPSLGDVNLTLITPTRVTATGHNGLILFPDDVPAGPTTTQYNGRIVYTYNTVTGFIEVLETSGKATDICAELS